MRRVAVVLCALALAVDVEHRDLFHGPGGSMLVPRDSTFLFVARDTSGWSPGFDVRSADGTEWSVKLGTATAADVHWVCSLFNRLTDEQWQSAFRAGGYNPEQTARYVSKLKAKIAQGLALTTG